MKIDRGIFDGAIRGRFPHVLQRQEEEEEEAAGRGKEHEEADQEGPNIP